jgi:transcriptional regulator with XRE-family HTH domain
LEVFSLTIGEKIRALRIERGMSQNELALACGYTSRASINKIELGKVDPPQSKIRIIAEALNVSPASLIVEDPTPVSVPQTEEARILCPGIDSMPPEDRKRALEMMKLMFDKYF